MSIKLFNFWRSSASWRVRIALHYKGIPFEYIPIHLGKEGGEQLKPAYRALNPMGQVPLLVVEEDGGIQRIAQSVAILEYLEERFPQPALLPSDPYQRALVRQVVELVNSGIQPLQNLSVDRYLRDVLKGDIPAWKQHFVGNGIAALESTLAVTAGTYSVGDQVTLADTCVVPQLNAARRFGVDLASCPTLLRVEAACLQLEAFQKAHADQQPDAE